MALQVDMPKKIKKMLQFVPESTSIHRVEGSIIELAEMLRDVNTAQQSLVEKGGIKEKIEAFFSVRKEGVYLIFHGSSATNTRLPGSDVDVLLVINECETEQVVTMLKEFVVYMNGSLDTSILTPGNLVRVLANDKDGNEMQLDLLCVWNAQQYEPIDSINKFTTRKPTMTDAYPAVLIRQTFACSSFMPTSMNSLQAIAHEITLTSHTRVACLFAKLVVKTSFSAAVIFCLVNMSKFYANNVFTIMQNMLQIMKAIREAVTLPCGSTRMDLTPDTKTVFETLSKFHHFNHGIYILMPHQLVQIAKAVPDFTAFLASMSLIDGNGNPIDVKDPRVNNVKLHSMCNGLIDLLRANKDVVCHDFKDKARAIIYHN